MSNFALELQHLIPVAVQHVIPVTPQAAAPGAARWTDPFQLVLGHCLGVIARKIGHMRIHDDEVTF